MSCRAGGASDCAESSAAKRVTIPFAVSVFPDELYRAPWSWAERAYPGNLIHYNQLDRGGHFAAWAQPYSQNAGIVQIARK